MTAASGARSHPTKDTAAFTAGVISPSRHLRAGPPRGVVDPAPPVAGIPTTTNAARRGPGSRRAVAQAGPCAVRVPD